MYPNQVIVDDDHTFVGFDGYRKVIDSVDVVLIACASKFHPMYAQAAVRAGKHVFVEKPHAIDPVGVRRMVAVCELAAQKGVSIQSGLQSRYHAGFQETVKRIHDGAIGEIVAAQSMFLRGPYRLFAREPGLTEIQYQFFNWYHFRWLSGDDVPQSLVHNLDRISWALKEEMPKSCFGLGGRSASFGNVYGDMFDHHTVVYEYASGARVYGLCRTQVNTYGSGTDILMGTQGKCDLGACRIEGKTKWSFTGRHNSPQAAEQRLYPRGPRRQADQRRPLHGQQHADRRDGPDGLLHGPARHLGGRLQIESPVRSVAGRIDLRHVPANPAGQDRELSSADAGDHEARIAASANRLDGYLAKTAILRAESR